MITLHNYEIYFADYLDGNLPESELAAFKAFLLIHPELAELLEDTEQAKLKPPVISYPHKNRLKKTSGQECEDYYAIAAAENEWTESEKAILGEELNHPDFKAKVAVYQQLRLQADPNIRFIPKDKLYRKKKKAVFYIRLSSVAAAIGLLFTIGSFFHGWNEVEQNRIAQTEKIIPVSRPNSLIIGLATPEINFPNQPIKTKIRPISKTKIVPLCISALDIAGLDPNLPTPELGLTIINKTEMSAEIILTESAKAWKSSSKNFQSGNIITSAINAGKYLTEKLETSTK